MHGEMQLEHENKCLVVVFLRGISESVPSVLDNLFLGYALAFQPGCPNRTWQYPALRQQDCHGDGCHCTIYILLDLFLANIPEIFKAMSHLDLTLDQKPF